MNSCVLLQKMHPKTSRDMFYTSNVILIFKNIQLETSRGKPKSIILRSLKKSQLFES